MFRINKENEEELKLKEYTESKEDKKLADYRAIREDNFSLIIRRRESK